jgi:hypothetical protein
MADATTAKPIDFARMNTLSSAAHDSGAVVRCQHEI